ncbi:hypothetical protein KSF78_0006942 [Schistosoma japonicum]|nr:hypothetical protein KSF78_0006942 [Schistosoma japonicum]
MTIIFSFNLLQLQSPCGSTTPFPKHSDSSLFTSNQTQSTIEMKQSNQEIIQLLQSIIHNNNNNNNNNNTQNTNLHSLNVLNQLLQSPINLDESNNVLSSIIQLLTKQLLQSYQQQNVNNEPISYINCNNNNLTLENTIPKIKTQSVWTDEFNVQQNITELCKSMSNEQFTNKLTNVTRARSQNDIKLDQEDIRKLNPYETIQTQEINKTMENNWTNFNFCNSSNHSLNTNMVYSRQLTNVSRLLSQERPWMRSHHRDRFVVRITSVTHRCSCRTNTPNRNRTIDSKCDQCQGKECKRSEPRIYVTFQTQLPSLTLSDNTRKNGKHHNPLTGLRLGFSCPLTSNGPPMSDFNTPKVSERFDAWEQAGNRPGFRIEILTALQHTVSQMLELIRTKGFGSVKLDTDYVFFPPSADLQPIYVRRRPLSSSSDGSLTRVMGLERMRREIKNEPKNHSFSTKLSENLNYNEKPGQSVWSETIRGSEINNTTPSCINTSSSMVLSKDRPRTWYQIPGQNSSNTSPSLALSQNKSDYGINESINIIENDDYQSIDKQTGIEENNDNDKRIHNPRNLNLTDMQSHQSAQKTCWCNSNSMQYSSYHTLGHSPFLSTSQGTINPNAHKVLNQMNYSPYTTVDASRWFDRNLNTTNKLLRSLGAPYSTPVSPTQFILGESSNRNPPNDYKINQLETSASSELLRKSERPEKSENFTSENLQNTDNSKQKRDYLSKILQEISNCLHTNPQYPIVIMPTLETLNTTEHGQTMNTDNRKPPLVFQIPHSNSVFIGLPATSGVNPRVMTASPTNAVVILPSPPSTTNQQSTTQQYCQHPPLTNTQPTILTGPKQGYLLIITPDNKYEYIPQP